MNPILQRLLVSAATRVATHVGKQVLPVIVGPVMEKVSTLWNSFKDKKDIYKTLNTTCAGAMRFFAEGGLPNSPEGKQWQEDMGQVGFAIKEHYPVKNNELSEQGLKLREQWLSSANAMHSIIVSETSPEHRAPYMATFIHSLDQIQGDVRGHQLSLQASGFSDMTSRTEPQF